LYEKKTFISTVSIRNSISLQFKVFGVILVLLLTSQSALAGDQYWGGSGVWDTPTITGWSAVGSTTSPYTSTWTAGSVAYFIIPNSTLTGPSTNGITISGIVANENVTVTRGSGAKVFGCTGANSTTATLIPINVASGKVFDLGAQTIAQVNKNGISKSGLGELALDGNNYNGGFTLAAGQVTMKSNSALGSASSPLTITGGTLAANTSISPQSSSITIGGDFTIGATTTLLPIGTGTNISTNTINFGIKVVSIGSDTRTITIGGTGTYTFGGVISGNSGVGITIGTTIPEGTTPGVLIFGGANTYTGTTTINSGILRLNNTSALGTTDAGTVITTTTNTFGGALDLYGTNYTTAEPLTVAGNGYGGGAIMNTLATPATFSGAITLTGNTVVAAGQASITLNSSTALSGTGQLTLGGATGGNAVSALSMTGNLVKAGYGTWTISGANSYTGATIVNTATLKLGASGVIPDASPLSLNGGTLSTGATTGFSETVGTLALTDNSTIALGTGVHSLTFADSHSISWTSGKTITITGWTGTAATSGTAGKVFIGTDANALTNAQLSQIRFEGFQGAMLLSTGELVPLSNLVVTSIVNASVLGLNANSVVTVNSGGELTINQSTAVKSITIAAGAKLTVTGTNALSATNGITLQSSSSATATFVDNYTDPTITATVEQYLPQGRNWYVASPIETNIANAGNLTGAGAISVSYYSEQYGWQHDYTGSLAEGVGYIAVSSAGSNTNKISCNGKLNSGDVPVTLTKKGSTFAGYNLIANPYPSYINPMTAINANPNLDGTIWYRTRKTVAPYEYKFETVNTTSGVGTNAAGTGMVTGYIPPMQAFWVKTNLDEQLFTFTNAMRDHARNVTVGAGTVPTTPLKAKKEESISLARIVVSGNAGSDEAVLYFDQNASNGFDKYDSRKMFESVTATTPEIYTAASNEKLVINGLNAVQYDIEIPLGFIAKQTGDYSISKSEMTNFEVGTRIMLKDKLQPANEIELSDGVVYNFTSQPTTSTDRFSLLFRAPGVTTGIVNATKTNTQVFVSAANQITIITSEMVTYSIYNAVGMLIENGKTTGKLQTLNCKLNTGVYVVKVNNQSTRVVIK